MRLDKLLWFLRLARTRTRAQAWIAEGHIRRNGQRVERQDLPVTAGDVLTLPLAIAQWPSAPVSAPAWGSAVAVGVLSTGFAYALYYRLIQRIGAARAVTVTYLVPPAAVAWAWSPLGEALTWPMGLACALILGSVALSQQRR